ncbi:hypothetical protein TNCV_3109541 [Trichonephila clavipes]|nr:hypothetical protein TNCV_3109541 [Trichonephila clavipes]
MASSAKEQKVQDNESCFNLWDHDGRIRVRRYVGERCLPKCIIERHRVLTPGVMSSCSQGLEEPIRVSQMTLKSPINGLLGKTVEFADEKIIAPLNTLKSVKGRNKIAVPQGMSTRNPSPICENISMVPDRRIPIATGYFDNQSPFPSQREAPELW